MIRERSSWRTAQLAELLALYLASEHRSWSIGVQLVRSFMAWAPRKGEERATVAAFAANDGARRFYRRMGFAPFEIMFEQSVEQPDGNT